MSLRASFHRFVVVVAALSALLCFASSARADLCDDGGPACDKCRVYACMCTNPPDFACTCSPGDTCEGLSPCGSEYGFVYEYCDATCCNSAVDSGPVHSDAGFDTKPLDGATDATTSDASTTDTASDAPNPFGPLVEGDVCYVLVHGSNPLGAGPSPNLKAGSTYWGTGTVDDAESMNADQRGQFIHTVLTGEMKTDPQPEDPHGVPHLQRWAAVAYDGTWPFYWAAVDVLQQLDAIENEQTPMSLEWLEVNGVLQHAQGTNFCKKGDKLVLIGHSMGNLAIAFLLENMRPNDLNYEFLRRGGYSNEVPYYLVGDPSPNITSVGDPRAKIFNRNHVGTDKKVPWSKPTVILHAGDAPTGPGPNDTEKCQYPAPGFDPYKSKAIFPATSGGICRGDPGTQTVEDTLGQVAYAYSVDGPLRGTNFAKCDCEGNVATDASTLCKYIRNAVDTCFLPDAPDPSLACKLASGTVGFISKGPFGFATCNPALESMQTDDAYLVENMSEQPPGRFIFTMAGLDPTFVQAPLDSITLASRGLDCFEPGNPKFCPLYSIFKKLGFIPDGTPDPVDGVPSFSPAMNDTAVPIASAMGCRIDLWSEDASLSVGDLTLLAGPDYRHSMCVGNEKIWPGWVVNDVAIVLPHIPSAKGVERRDAYVPSDSIWTTLINPRWGNQNYLPGDLLAFGEATSVGDVSPICFERNSKSQSNPALCGDASPGRKAFAGCSPQCLRAANGAVIERHDPTFARVIWTEEHYTRGR